MGSRSLANTMHFRAAVLRCSAFAVAAVLLMSVALLPVKSVAEEKADEQSLALNGSAVHTDLGMDYYYAALFSETPDVDAEQLAAQDRLRMEITVLVDDWSKRRFNQYWNQSIAINNSDDIQNERADEILKFSQLVKAELIRGDRIIIEKTAGKGTTVLVNGVKLMHTQYDNMFSLFLNVWVGPRPPSSIFKSSILGAESTINAALMTSYQSLNPSSKRRDEVKKWAAKPKIEKKSVVVAPSPVDIAPVVAAAAVGSGVVEPSLSAANEVIVETPDSDSSENNIVSKAANGNELDAAEVNAVADAGINKPDEQTTKPFASEKVNEEVDAKVAEADELTEVVNASTDTVAATSDTTAQSEFSTPAEEQASAEETKDTNAPGETLTESDATALSDATVLSDATAQSDSEPQSALDTESNTTAQNIDTAETEEAAPTLTSEESIVASEQAAEENETSQQQTDQAVNGASNELLTVYHSNLLALTYQKIVYPSSAVKRNREGKVVIKVTVNRNGEVQETSYAEESKYKALNRAASKAIAQSNPFPAVPEAVEGSNFEFLVPINFQLN